MEFSFNLSQWRRKSPVGLVTALVAIADPVARRALRQSVARSISSTIIEVDSKSACHHAVTFQEIDLIIADVEINGCCSIDIIELIRHGRLHRHAFPVVIMVVDHGKDELVHRVMECGADLVLAADSAARQIPDQLARLVEGRRPFVVTPHYTGPERRDSDRAAPASSLAVPNPLAARLSRVSEEDYRRQLSMATHAISLVRRSFYLVPDGPPAASAMGDVRL